MHLDRFWPAVLRDYAYTGTFHMRPKPEFEQGYMDVLMTLGTEAVMTTPCVMHMLNTACRCLEDGEIYLEIGTYRGSTLIGALLGNDARAVAVDDRSEPMHQDGRDDQAEFERHLRLFGMTERVLFDKATYQDFYRRSMGAIERELPFAHIGVIFLDGFAQDADEVVRMLDGAVPLLAPRALIVLDDSMLEKTDTGVRRWLEAHPEAKMLANFQVPPLAIMPKFPTWWDGLFVLAWEAKGDE